MLLTKEVEVKVRNNDIKYYESLGYEVPKKKSSENYYKRYKQEIMYDLSKPIIVKVEDLPKGSHIIVQVLCDYCNEQIVYIPYYKYVDKLKCVAKTACKNCKSKKQADCNLIIYGVHSTSELDWVKEKVKNSNLERYGVDNYAKTKECREKMESTMQIKYGVSHNSQLPDYQKKRDNTCRERYGESYSKQFVEKALETFRNKTGYNYPSQSPEIKAKIIQSYIDKYGVDNPNKLKEIKAKAVKTLYVNNSQKVSKQQQYIFDIYKSKNQNVYLNYPVSSFSADICLLDEKVDIEIDFGGHDLQVKLGKLTQEEFNHKELVRDKIFKSEGYKIIRIKSKTDKLPTDQILLQMLSEAKQYFSETSHSWITYDIDNSLMLNAVNKDVGGAFYNFGVLRTIKKSVL